MLPQLLEKPLVWESVSGLHTDLPFTCCETLGQLFCLLENLHLWRNQRRKNTEDWRNSQDYFVSKGEKQTHGRSKPKNGAHWNQQESEFPKCRLCLSLHLSTASFLSALTSFLSDYTEFILLQTFFHFSLWLLPLQSLLISFLHLSSVYF